MKTLSEELGSVSDEQMAKAIVHAYTDTPNLGNSTLSATKLTEVAEVRRALDHLSRELAAAGGLALPEVKTAYDTALRFGDRNQMDLGDFAAKLTISGAPATVKTAASLLLRRIKVSSYAKTDAADSKYRDATGLSVYGPLPRGSGGLRLDPAYSATQSLWSFSSWETFLKSYPAPVTPPPPPLPQSLGPAGFPGPAPQPDGAWVWGFAQVPVDPAGP